MKRSKASILPRLIVTCTHNNDGLPVVTDLLKLLNAFGVQYKYYIGVSIPMYM